MSTSVNIGVLANFRADAEQEQRYQFTMAAGGWPSRANGQLPSLLRLFVERVQGGKAFSKNGPGCTPIKQ